MHSEGAVYAKVPVGGAAALEAAVRQAREGARSSGPLGVVAFDPAAHAWALVDRWGRRDDLPAWAAGPDLDAAPELAALSRLAGEVVAFYEVEEDLGVYAAWRDGARVRALVWADGRWEQVEGQAQPWEAGLFAPAALAAALEAAADDGRDPEEVRAAFARGALVAGAAWPLARGLPVRIREALRAPAYGVPPWPPRRDAVRALRGG